MLSHRFDRYGFVVIAVSMVTMCGCDRPTTEDINSLLFPALHRSEVWGFVAGFGTTFAAVPDLIRMFKRRSSVGMNPTMAGILAVFQVIWIYYGILIRSRPVVGWNLLAVVINSLGVGAYVYFKRK